ncbi:hypothetical protein [Wukongibacter sp. M2B1]|uniref:hypothetical protein n=1 Tax=Wukongibacter sp. M2B1 TaxID=3088895 RepID=UPI003D7A8923
MKKIVSLFVVFSVLMAMVIGVYAESNAVTDKVILSKDDLSKKNFKEARKLSANEVTLSEYDLIKESFGKSYNQLLEMGIDEKQAKKLANVEDTIMKKVRELHLLDNKTLLDQGYSQKQIKAIRSINTKFSNNSRRSCSGLNTLSNSEILSSAEARKLLGEVSMHVKPYSITKELKYVYFDWNWDSKPFVVRTDGIGFAWDGGFRTEGDKVGAKIEYVNGNNSGTKKISRSDIDILAGAGWGFDIQMSSGPSHTAPAWAKSGQGGFWLTNPNNKKTIQIVWKYGHGMYTLTGGCVDIKGTLSIGFSDGVKEMCEDDAIWKW